MLVSVARRALYRVQILDTMGDVHQIRNGHRFVDVHQMTSITLFSPPPSLDTALCVSVRDGFRTKKGDTQQSPLHQQGGAWIRYASDKVRMSLSRSVRTLPRTYGPIRSLSTKTVPLGAWIYGVRLWMWFGCGTDVRACPVIPGVKGSVT